MTNYLKRGNALNVEDVFLRNIGVKNLNDINAWFTKSYSHGYRLDGVKEAVNIIRQFKHKAIRIFGDYDGDGITATSQLYMALKWIGCTNIAYRIPKRFSEGFGLNVTMLEEVEEDDALIITCDNGIAQAGVIRIAKERGMTVIVIDHHLPVCDDNGNSILPCADVIIDPNAIPNSADFNGYCAAGLVYKVASELLGYNKDLCRKLLCLAAIGTVTDVMELREENYVFVRNGLKLMKISSICPQGIYALMSSMNLSTHITAKDIGFSIGPVLNASSRMNDDGAKDAIELCISEKSWLDSRKIAERLKQLNDDRKRLCKEAMKIAEELIEEQGLENDIPLVLYLPGQHEGIIGIIAGKLAEKYSVPSFVVTDCDETRLKGSGRGAGNYNVKEALDNCKEYLVTYGGHEGAGGLTLEKESFESFKAAMIETTSDGYIFEEEANNFYDLEIKASEVPKMIEMLEQYAPFGEGNAEPVFLVTDFSCLEKQGEAKIFSGPDKENVKLTSPSCVAFGLGLAHLLDDVKRPKKISVIGTLSLNYWKETVTPQIYFTDVISVQ